MTKIIFLDQLGCYASLLAASYRTGKIKTRPAMEEILGLRGFAAHRDLSLGNSLYLGQDAGGNQIYTLGTGGEVRLIEVSAGEINKILDISNEVLLIDVSRFNSLAVRLCSYLRLVSPLKKLALYGAAVFLRSAMPRLAREVEKIDGKSTMD